MIRWLIAILTAGIISSDNQDVIRVKTHLVEVDVVVRSGGKPVRNLSREDFQLFDNGVPRAFTLFSTTAPQPARDNVVRYGDDTIVSNRLQGLDNAASTIVFLVDRLNTSVVNQIYGNWQLGKFLKTMAPGQRFAIYELGASLRVVQGITDDPEPLRRALAAVGPEFNSGLDPLKLVEPPETSDPTRMGFRAPIELSTIEEEVAREEKMIRQTVGTWKAIAHHLAAIPGRKSLIWLSTGFPMCVPPRFPYIKCFEDKIIEAAQDMSDARVTMYSINTHGLRTTSTINDLGIDTMLRAAKLTGGLEFHNTNDLRGAIQESVDDSEFSYTLGFYVPEAEMDGLFHELRVKIPETEFEVRHRKGYFARTASPMTEKERQIAMTQALSNPLEATSIGLHAIAQREKASPDQCVVRVSINTADLQLVQPAGLRRNGSESWTGGFDAALTWAPTPPRRSTVEPVEISLSEERYREALAKTLVWQTVMTVPKDARWMRVVIMNKNTDAIGSISIPIH